MKPVKAIQDELRDRLEYLEKEGKLLEAQRLEQRTRYDLEMLREVGYCNGVENYARHLAGRPAGSPPECLIDYFPKDWLLVIDESHVTIPQIHAMYNGDRARKMVLIEHGFRLPSAADNRPLKAEEFWDKVDQCVFVSATPVTGKSRFPKGAWSSKSFAPLACSTPKSLCGPRKVRWMICWGNSRAGGAQRAGADHHPDQAHGRRPDGIPRRTGVRVRYLHSEIHSIERIELIQDLRDGNFDVLVGVNLLREGLDSAGSFPGGDFGCRQGRLFAGGAIADSDHWPGSAPCAGAGHPLRRQPHRQHGQSH
jgi:excinuclease ABC subunit B